MSFSVGCFVMIDIFFFAIMVVQILQYINIYNLECPGCTLPSHCSSWGRLLQTPVTPSLGTSGSRKWTGGWIVCKYKFQKAKSKHVRVLNPCFRTRSLRFFWRNQCKSTCEECKLVSRRKKFCMSKLCTEGI